MEHATIDAFRQSLRRCLSTPDFLHDFYERFIASGDEIREKFRKTEFPRQTRVLADSLYIIAMAAESRSDAFAWKELDRLAAVHSRQGLDIDPKHYDTWLECLVAAARTHDPELTPEIEQAWRDCLGPGIEHLRSRY
jgi:hemoglobin-like flavoprotein